jgi:hypothetical protein
MEHKIIASKGMSIVLPWEEGMLEWLNEQYPNSGYHIVIIEMV